MTTRVTIKNEDESGHPIELTIIGSKHVVEPGDSLTTHVWEGVEIIIKELPISFGRKG